MSESTYAGLAIGIWDEDELFVGSREVFAPKTPEAIAKHLSEEFKMKHLPARVLVVMGVEVSLDYTPHDCSDGCEGCEMICDDRKVQCFACGKTVLVGDAKEEEYSEPCLGGHEVNIGPIWICKDCGGKK